MLEEAAVIARGGDAKAVVRDVEANRCIALPIIDRERFVKGFPRAQLYREASGTPGPVLPDGFVFQAGQPEEVRKAYRQAMGLDIEPPRHARADAR